MLMPAPSTRFDPVRFETRSADKYELVSLDSNQCLAGLAAARSRVLYAVRWDTLTLTAHDSMFEWDTPRQIEAVDRLLTAELNNRETTKTWPIHASRPLSHDQEPGRLRLHQRETARRVHQREVLDLDFTGKAHDFVFHGRTGRGKSHLTIAPDMKAAERGMNVRFRQTAELVLQLGKVKRGDLPGQIPKDLVKADLIILDVFGKWGTIFADDKLAATIIDYITHHDHPINSPALTNASAKPSHPTKAKPDYIQVNPINYW